MAEVSSKVEIENVGEGSCDIDVSESQDLVNGKSRGCHGNGNAEEADGSYVFVSHNETVGDDQAKSEVNCKAVENEEENMDDNAEKNGGVGDSSVLEDAGEKDLGESELEKRDARADAEEMKESAVEDSADDLMGHAVAGNEKLIKVEPAQEVEESQDSKAQTRSIPDLEMQEPVEVEEKSEGQTETDLGIDAAINQESETIVSEVSKQDNNEGKNSVDSGQERESGDLITHDISSDGPKVDQGVVMERSNQTGTVSAASISPETKPTTNPYPIDNGGSDPIVMIPVSDESINVQSESEVIMAPVSVENCDVGFESAAPTNFESGDVGSDSDVAKVFDSDKNVDVRLDSRSVEVPDSDQNGNVLSESRSVDGTDSNENGIIQSELEVEIPNFDENGSIESESGAVDVADSSDNVQSELEAVEVPGSDENGNVQSESVAVDVTDPDDNGDAQLDSKAIEVPGSHENGDIQSDSRTLDIPASSEQDCGQLESEGVSLLPPDQDGKAHFESKATSIDVSDHNDDVQLQSEMVSAFASDERCNDLVTDPARNSVSGIATVSGLLDDSQPMTELNTTTGLADSLTFPASSETMEVSNDIGVESAESTTGNTIYGDGELDVPPEPEVVEVLNDIGVESADSTTCNTIYGDGELDVPPEPEVGLGEVGCAPTGHGENKDDKEITGRDADVCRNSDPVILDESINATDFEVRVPKRAENSADSAADVATIISAEADSVESDETFGKPVGAPNIGCIKEDIEVELVANGVEANPEGVCDTSTEDNFELSIIKENSTSDTDGGIEPSAEVVEPDVKIIQTDDSPHLNNDTAEVSIKNEPEDDGNKLSCGTEMVPSSAKSVVARSTLLSDTVNLDAQTEASESLAGFTGSELAETDAIKHESEMSNCSGEDANAEVDVDVATVEDANSSSHKSDGVISQKGDSSEGNNVASDIERKPFYFLSRVPRYDDEKLAEEIRHAQVEVDQKTESRDIIKAEIQKMRVSCKEYDNTCKAAAADERSARDALRSKRQDIDSLQSVINRVKNAMSVDDIDSRMVNMEHMIQHETLPLKEEKQLIREIKQLKQLREQISSTLGTKGEVQQALDEKDQTEERLKVVRKELDMLRSNLSKSEAVTKAAWKKFQDERDKLNQLHNQFKAADNVRQEAFVHLQSLRKQSREKNKYFFKYRDNLKAANDLALSKDKDSLQSFCIDQVETFMNLWNNDDEFRKDYIRCNSRSTLRRFGTFDGRSLGPDEEPPVVSRTLNVRLAKSTAPSERTEKHEAIPPVLTQTEKIIHVKDVKCEDDKPATVTGEQKIQTKTTKAVKQVRPASTLPIVSSEDKTVEPTKEEKPTEEEEPKLSKEEEELARKAEEKRKQKEAAKLKEQRRLEEIAKAKEAMERKKKKEEKAKAKATLRSQKEAEEREKEREKRLRKKERRKGIASDDAFLTAEEQSATGSETQTESRNEAELPEKQETAQPKKANRKPTQFTKLNKPKSIPLPLRNRGKRRLQPWMWIVIVALLIIALFLVGNSGFSFGSGLRAFCF